MLTSTFFLVDVMLFQFELVYSFLFLDNVFDDFAMLLKAENTLFKYSCLFLVRITYQSDLHAFLMFLLQIIFN